MVKRKIIKIDEEKSAMVVENVFLTVQKEHYK